MKIVVIGMGEVGKHIAEVLGSQKHDVTIIDQDPEKLARAEERMDAMALLGHGASLKVLQRGKVDKVDLVIAVTNNDEVNVLAALTAKQLGAPRVISRVSRQLLFQDREHGSYGQLLGLDLVINEQVLTAIEIQRLIKTVGAIAVEYFAENRVEMVQLPIDEELPLVGKKLHEIDLPKNCVVAGLLRSGALIIPGGADSILGGDEVFLIGTLENMPQLERMFGKDSERSARKVIIVGGGDVGFAVARLLEEDRVDVVLVERDKERCTELSRQLDRTVILNGDGTSLSLLREESLGTCDVFVSVSGDDETNLMASLLAKHLGAHKTVALVAKPDYVPLYEALGIDATVSPRLFAARRILKYVREGVVVSAAGLEEGKAQILEIIPAQGSPIVDKPLKEVNFPRGALVAAVSADQGAFVPNGNDTLRPGNVVVVFTTPSVRSSVERMFRKRLFAF